jgi:SUKH-3 immunity protein
MKIDNESNIFYKEVKDILEKNGWFSSRKISKLVTTWKYEMADDSEAFVLFDEAERVLLEFGGIKINERGGGVNQAQEPFEINPLLAKGEADRFADFELDIGQKLYPLGECWGSNFFLAIAEDGKVFALMMEIFLVGNTFEEALNNLIQGIKLEV